MGPDNNRMTQRIGRIIAWLFAMAIVITLPLAIVARDLGAVVFSQPQVESILQARLVSSDALDRVLADSLFSEGEFDRQDEWFSRAVKHLSEAERHEILRLLLPAGWIEQQIAAATEAVFAWFESDQTVPVLFLDMEPIKARLLGDSLDQVVELIVQSWPACSPDELERLQMAFEVGGEVPPFLCEPPEPLRGLIVDFATRNLANETSALPDRVPLVEREALNLPQLQSAKVTLRVIRALLAWSWLVPLAALGLIMALKVRSAYDLGRWWGIPLLLSGAATFILNMILRATRGRVLGVVLREVGAPETARYGAIDLFLKGAASLTLRLMLLHALILSAAGAIIWLIFVWRARRRSDRLNEMASGSIRPLESDERAGVAQQEIESPPPLPPFDKNDETQADGDPPSGIFG